MSTAGRRGPGIGRAGVRLGRAPLVLAAAAAIAGGVYGVGALRARQVSREALPRTSGEIHVPGLGGPVEIARDARGIPHIEAASEADALFGLGFAQAQDRIGQLLWLRAAARGRAAELVGAAALPADREARTTGIGRLADAQARRLDAETRAALEAFSAGVNALLERLQRGDDPLPLALRGLDVAFEPWTPADSIAVAKLEAWALGYSADASLVLADLIESLGGAGARAFFPERRRPRPPAQPLLPDPALARQESPQVGSMLRAAAGLDARGAGSSAVAVGARASASGRPLVAGDAHAQPTVPARLYEAHVRGGRLDAAGAMLPGTPAIWSGHGRHVAWAASFAPAVVMDLFVESLTPDGSRQHDARGLVPVSERVETLQVRGAAAETVRVRTARHGPLVNELVGGDRPPLALAWTGALPGDGVTGLLRAARAANAAELRAALREHHEPILAVAYADDRGAAGLQLAGTLPRRRLDTGGVPVPGRSGDYDWTGTVPFDLLPELPLTGDRSIVVAADGRIGPLDAADDIEWLWRPGDTAARLETLLAAAIAEGPLDVLRLAALSRDVYGERARRVAAAALVLAGDPSTLGSEAREVAAALSRWDGSLAAESVGGAMFQLLLQRITRELLVERLGEPLAIRYARLPQTAPTVLVERWLQEAASAPPGEAPAERDALADLVRRALRETWLWLNVRAGPNRERWAWGRLHALRFRPQGLFPASAAEQDAALGPFPLGGDDLTVSEGGYDAFDPFEVRVASTHRFAIDTAQLDQAVTALVPGQSEHPGSVHLADAVPDWLAGRPRLLLTSPLLVEETTRERLWLRP